MHKAKRFQYFCLHSVKKSFNLNYTKNNSICRQIYHIRTTISLALYIHSRTPRPFPPLAGRGRRRTAQKATLQSGVGAKKRDLCMLFETYCTYSLFGSERVMKVSILYKHVALWVAVSQGSLSMCTFWRAWLKEA